MSCGALSPELELRWRKCRAEFWQAGNRHDQVNQLDGQTIGPSYPSSAMFSETPQKLVDLTEISEAIGHTLTVLDWADVRVIDAAAKVHSRTMKIRRQPYAVCLHYGRAYQDTHLSASGI